MQAAAKGKMSRYDDPPIGEARKCGLPFYYLLCGLRCPLLTRLAYPRLMRLSLTPFSSLPLAKRIVLINGEIVMKHSSVTAVLASLMLAATGIFSTHVRAEDADLGCKLQFSLSGWSAIYKHAEGSGVVTCANGTSLPVKISAKGAGLTVGKSKVDNGTGRFTNVHSVSDVLGSYAEGEAHAGVVKSGSVQVLTKGTVSLALAGAGEGIDLGIDVGEFTLTKAK